MLLSGDAGPLNGNVARILILVSETPGVSAPAETAANAMSTATETPIFLNNLKPSPKLL